MAVKKSRKRRVKKNIESISINPGQKVPES